MPNPPMPASTENGRFENIGPPAMVAADQYSVAAESRGVPRRAPAQSTRKLRRSAAAVHRLYLSPAPRPSFDQHLSVVLPRPSAKYRLDHRGQRYREEHRSQRVPTHPFPLLPYISTFATQCFRTSATQRSYQYQVLATRTPNPFPGFLPSIFFQSRVWWCILKPL